MSVSLLRGDIRRLPLADESVDLIVTSPPYWAQRSYRDGGEHYDGQLGSEPSAREFLEALWVVTAECWRVLKPTGSMWVNLGDKRSGSSAPGTTTGLTSLQGTPQQRRVSGRGAGVQGERSGGLAAYPQAGFGRPKSKMLLPHRYAIGCEDGAADPDGIGWIVRQDQVWWKANGLPESARDRTRDAHEYWFHLTKEPNYFAGVDHIRQPHAEGTAARYAAGYGDRSAYDAERPSVGYSLGGDWTTNPLGAIPPSVWKMATEPLVVPSELEVDHFAAFPTEWPRRLILGWSPSGICTVCASPRRPIVTTASELYRDAPSTGRPKKQSIAGSHGNGFNGSGYPQVVTTTTIQGVVCACTPFTDHPERRRRTSTPKRDDLTHRPAPATGRSNSLPAPGLPVREYHLDRWHPPATRPAVVLDPFGGTGTTALAAHTLGRHGISIDLSADYCRLAAWRTTDTAQAAKVRRRTNEAAQLGLHLDEPLHDQPSTTTPVEACG